MSETLTLPVLPLRDTVVFPGVVAPIQVGRASTLGAIRKASESEDKRLFVVAQRDNSEKVAPERLYTIGTVARIEQMQRGRGIAQLLLRGESRGIALRVASVDGGYLEAVVRIADEMPAVDPDNPAFVGLLRELRVRAAELGEKSGLAPEMVGHALSEAADAAALADLVANHLELELEERQALLETLSVEERLRRVLVHVQRQISVVDAQEEIKSKVQQELGDRQREMVLREQLKAIQRELGEGEGAEDTDDLAQKLAALDLPEEARKEVDREFGRLGRTNRDSMEHQVIRTYLETVAELPWTHRSEDHFDLGEAAKILDEDHYGLKDVKDRVLEFLAVRQLRAAREREESEAESGPAETAADEVAADEADKPKVPGNEDDRAAKGPILLFVGPPGVGKTSIAKSIARAMGREYVRISLGGARDEADIRGHRRTYVGAMPGRILNGMKQAGTRNPVFLLDEVDKLGASYQGDPASALLEVLDPAQNDSFVDHYLGVSFDLSEVLFIATANFIEAIPGPLRDRLEVVEFTGYTEGEKLEIAKRYLVPRQTRRNALDAERLTITDGALSAVISGYTREAGVRQLEREIGQLARKVARRIAAGEAERAVVESEQVGELLGRPKIHPEKAAGMAQVGVATGMFYTPVGGDILFVEVSTMKGKGDLVLTGQLGEVMKESARAAWSYARSHAAELGLHEADFDRDVPAAAIPKDGPSAGITIAAALISALSGRPVRHDLAMTGELTLTGRVLPIGGVKEKVLGAARAGIWEIVLPRENEVDLEDLPHEVREKIRAFPVDSLSEVLELALIGDAAESSAAPLRGDLGEAGRESASAAH
jgi:ATP-dependent Lon protease